MIDKAYWNKIASQWKKQDDGIFIPTVDTGRAGDIDPNEGSFGDISDNEIDDILADLDLEDI